MTSRLGSSSAIAILGLLLLAAPAPARAQDQFLLSGKVKGDTCLTFPFTFARLDGARAPGDRVVTVDVAVFPDKPKKGNDVYLIVCNAAGDTCPLFSRNDTDSPGALGKVTYAFGDPTVWVCPNDGNKGTQNFRGLVHLHSDGLATRESGSFEQGEAREVALSDPSLPEPIRRMSRRQ